MVDASIDPSAFKATPYPFSYPPLSSASGLWKFDKAINNYPRAHRELRCNFWITPTVSCRSPSAFPSFTSFRAYLIPLFPLSLSSPFLFSLWSSRLACRFFSSALSTVSSASFSSISHRQTFEPLHGCSTWSRGVSGGYRNGGTRCTVRPVSTSAIFAVVSIPHLAPFKLYGPLSSFVTGNPSWAACGFSVPSGGERPRILSPPGCHRPVHLIHIRRSYVLDFSGVPWI